MNNNETYLSKHSRIKRNKTRKQRNDERSAIQMENYDQSSLGKANITCNKNSIPFDTQSPMITSGVRLGTPASTTRGFGQKEFVLVGQLISKLLKELAKNPENNSKIEIE